MGEKESVTAEDFNRWRPRCHLIAPDGWMNDPCGLAYSPHTKRYHVGFQWNPKGYTWGNMSWGSATSPDLIHWEVSSVAGMGPEEDIDQGGVWTGCACPPISTESTKTDGTLLCFYTSATKLPIHHSLPYNRGSEQVRIATTTDMGRTWQKRAGDSIIQEPPVECGNVVGFRDPFVRYWESMDALLGSKPRSNLYGILSGSIRDTSPAVFLYRIETDAIDRWEYLGQLIRIQLNHAPSRWSGDFGVNWEVTTSMSLPDPSGNRHEFLVTGVEGVKMTPERSQWTEARAGNAAKWMAGELCKDPEGKISMKYRYGGSLDYGAFYAANSLWDPVIEEYVVFGWVQESDATTEHWRKQNWSGLISLPRIPKLATYEDVVQALKSPLGEIDSLDAIKNDRGNYTIQTFTTKPDPRIESLRDLPSLIDVPAQSLGSGESTPLDIRFQEPTAQWEIDISLALGVGVERIGLCIYHSAGQSKFAVKVCEYDHKSPSHIPTNAKRVDYKKKTVIYFDTAEESIVVDRSNSSESPEVNRSSEIAPHTLFRFADGSSNQDSTRPQPELEDLDMRIFFDTSVLETFVNGRTAITARVFPESSTCYDIGVFVEPSEGVEKSKSYLKHCKWWKLKPIIRT
jgi:beta-fructofuranosidase